MCTHFKQKINRFSYKFIFQNAYTLVPATKGLEVPVTFYVDFCRADLKAHHTEMTRITTT